MRRDHLRGLQLGGWAVARILLLAGLSATLGTLARAAEAERINLTVIVTDGQTGKPLSQAQLTLQFHEPGKVRHKLIAYTAKTNAQGRCRFIEIPEGTVHLIVTDPKHQTFGRDFDIDKSHSELDVKLKPPHPLL